MHPLLNQVTKAQVAKFLAVPTHGLGLSGPEGAGKLFLGKYLCSELLSTKNIDEHPYFLAIDCSKTTEDTGIEQIRQIKKFLQLKVPGDKAIKRCVLIGSVEQLSHAAQNALLKTLEEPPEDTVLIITSNNKQGLLPTTISRVQWINVLPLSLDKLQKAFSSDYGQKKLERAYYLSRGYIGLFSEIINDDIDHPAVKAIEEAKELLSVSKLERVAKIDTLIKSDEVQIQQLLLALHKILQAKLHSEINKSNSAKASLIKKLELINDSINSLKYNANNKLLLTNLLYSL